jgi:two-component system sensor histidine kinase KdpD
VQAALNNFFKIENLAALRETALRQVAEDVEIKRLIREPGPAVRRDEEGLALPDGEAPQAIAERLLAIVDLEPASERVVRRAWRSAQRLDARLDVLLVRPPGRPPSPEDRSRLEALRRLVAMLGARLRIEQNEDQAAAAIATARALGSTYVLLAPPSRRGRLARLGLGSDLLSRLLDGLPGVDVRIVADPTQRPAPQGEEEIPPAGGLAGEDGEGDPQAARDAARRAEPAP